MFDEALLFNGKPPTLAVLVLPALKALLGVDVVDDGPMAICEVGTDVADGSVAVFGVLWGVPALLLSVTVGIPGTVEHTASKLSMSCCALSVTLTEGSAAIAQLTQPCTSASMALVQIQLVKALQAVTDDWTIPQIESHTPEFSCLARIMSNERAARWSSPSDVDVRNATIKNKGMLLECIAFRILVVRT